MRLKGSVFTLSNPKNSWQQIQKTYLGNLPNCYTSYENWISVDCIWICCRAALTAHLLLSLTGRTQTLKLAVEQIRLTRPTCFRFWSVASRYLRFPDSRLELQKDFRTKRFDEGQLQTSFRRDLPGALARCVSPEKRIVKMRS